MFRWAGEPELAEGRVFLYGGEVRTLAAREKNKNHVGGESKEGERKK